MTNATIEVLQPPKVGETLGEGDEIVTDDFRNFTKEKMKDLLRAFGLPVSGNREQLLDRLHEYASEKDKWTRYVMALTSKNL
jgi:hypothetical protein